MCISKIISLKHRVISIRGLHEYCFPYIYVNHTIDHQQMNMVTMFKFPGNPHGQTKANTFKLILPKLYLELNYKQFTWKINLARGPEHQHKY